MIRLQRRPRALMERFGRFPTAISQHAGLLLVLGAYSAFAAHDALVKALVAHYAAGEILFMRSLTVVVLCLTLGGRGVITRGLFSPVRNKLLVRSFLTLTAWLLYYSSARYLGLAQLITIYFASPLIVAVLAGPMLGERVTLVRWLALGIGFVGVVLAAHPSGSGALLPVLCVGAAAVIWAYTMILMRQIAAQIRGYDQIFLIGVIFVVVCGGMLPFVWRTPSLSAFALMLSLGLISTTAQLLLIEGVKRAQASVVAPMEFSGLLWSFVFGYLLFGDIPAVGVFLGAGLILLSGGMVVTSEIRQARRDRTAREVSSLS